MKPIYCILKLQSLWGLDISGRCCFELGCGHEHGFLVGGLEHFLFFHRLGMSSSQLTNSIIFQRGSYTNHQPDSMFNLGVLVIRSGSLLGRWESRLTSWGWLGESEIQFGCHLDASPTAPNSALIY